MRFRIFSALLFLLPGCATSGVGAKDQAAFPLEPLVTPKTATLPVPVGVNPPTPFIVSPEGQPGSYPKPPSGSGVEPPPSRTSERRPECTPEIVPHLGGDALHNVCADKVPLNDFIGFDVLVNGKRFDALQLERSTLWEVKTDNFDTYTAALRKIVIEKQVVELKRERDLAVACGFSFSVGVRSAAHAEALRKEDRSLNIVIMNWC
ncbi:MAG: DUF6310 domain-containing protein [Hyalangium sp.]|uniref:DUF6310 domain-containing protein n=1 Tax=Hyalangium sp. TaxID=2028555 RepID=UPI00389A761A